MSVVDRLFPRQRADAAALPAATVPGAAPPGTPARGAGVTPDDGMAELRARHRVLAHELADRQWDLGGLTYEMAVRDHFRLDVLVAHAARLQEVDAELAEVERLLRLEDTGAAGDCPACGAPHSRGAVYCWSCGAQLIPVETAGT
jgi:hypothetical protein